MCDDLAQEPLDAAGRSHPGGIAQRRRGRSDVSPVAFAESWCNVPARLEEKAPELTMSRSHEPTLAAFPNPLVRYFLATRPAFLSMTAIAVLVGLAAAAGSGVRLDPVLAALTAIFAVVAHAGVNVLNDYYDGLSGCDDANDERVFPFTGGSRFVQNGVLSLSAVGRFGYALLATVVLAGLWLTAHSAPGLIAIGLAGLLIGWAYSAPPLALQARGLGEVAIVAGLLLVVVGADFVERRAFAFAPVAAGLGFALLLANVLFIAQFPDRRADAAAGKRTIVVRLGAADARWGYALIMLLAYGWTSAMIASGRLPSLALISLAPAAASVAAMRGLWANAERPQALGPAIKTTIAAALSHGALMAAALTFAR
jgi:1,4-dihydroxy-2-naphthoate octaprenyltransferase